VDVIHVHCGEDLAVLPLARLAARRHGSPVVATVHLSVRHTLRPTTPRGIALRAAGGTVERWLLPGADAVIALTPSAAWLLRGDGIPADRVHVIPPGYDPVLFAAAAADPFPGLPRPRVAYVGRLVPQKDVGTLLEAFARLAAPAQLLVVGDGGRRQAPGRTACPDPDGQGLAAPPQGQPSAGRPTGAPRPAAGADGRCGETRGTAA
jgi:glycogen(starch) synthase